VERPQLVPQGLGVPFECELGGTVQGGERQAATPPDELMLMTAPAFRALISGSTAFVIRMTPKKLT
jgi:hypothetical protein